MGTNSNAIKYLNICKHNLDIINKELNTGINSDIFSNKTYRYINNNIENIIDLIRLNNNFRKEIDCLYNEIY